MLQKLPNKTLYRKRNRWAPKKNTRTPNGSISQRIFACRTICQKKDFSINGDFFTVQYQNEKLPRSQPYLLFHEILLVGSLAFFSIFLLKKGRPVKKFTMYFCCSMRENMSRSPRCAGRTICRQKTSSKTVSLQFPTKPHSTYKMTILLELLTLFETHKIVTNNEKRRVYHH